MTVDHHATPPPTGPVPWNKDFALRLLADMVRGLGLGAIMAEMYGKREGCAHGRGGSMHLFDRATRLFGGNAIVGGGLPLAVGLGLAAKMSPEADYARLVTLDDVEVYLQKKLGDA